MAHSHASVVWSFDLLIFLSKMVRVLVATSIREAAVGAPSNGLVRLTGATCRRASAPPAPACGLCLTEVSYGDFSEANLLIKRLPLIEDESEVLRNH